MARQYIIGTPFGAVGVDEEASRQWIGPGVGIDDTTSASGTTYNDDIAEATTAAAETVAGLADRQGPIAETGAAAETLGGLLTFTGAIAETATAADTVGGLLVVIGAIAESATALEDTDATVTAGGTTYNKDQDETTAAAETVGGLLVVIGAIAENSSAAETAAGLLTFTGAIAEAASAAETIGATVIPAGGTLYEEAVLETVGSSTYGPDQSAHTVDPTAGFTGTYTLGGVVTFAVPGQITGVRYWRPATATPQARNVALWDPAGPTLLATATGASDGAIEGWVTVSFATPYTVAADTEYVVAANTLDEFGMDNATFPMVNGDVTLVKSTFAEEGLDLYPVYDWSEGYSLFTDVVFRSAVVGAGATDTVTADVVAGEVTAPPPEGGPGPAGEGVRRRFELYLLPEEDDEPKPRRKRKLRLKKAEIEDKIEATVEYIEAGSPRPMSQQAMVAQVSTLMGLDALLEIDRRRVERTIYRYLQTLMEDEEEEGLAMVLLAA